MSTAMQVWFDKMSEEDKKAFLLQIMGPTREYVKDSEKEHTMTLLRLTGEPEIDCSSQRFVTHIYKMNNRCYHVTYFEGNNYEIEIRDE